MKKRILGLMLTLCMLLSVTLIMGISVSAEAYVCYIDKNTNSTYDTGDTKYETITEALFAAATSETTIRLLSDVTENITVAVNKNITLDLDGYVLKAKSAKSVIVNYGTLTIADSGATKEHYFTYVKDGAWTLDAETPVASETVKIIDINDFTLNAVSDESKTYHIKVSGGCITGGTGFGVDSLKYGGGILNFGTLTVSGNIVGNTASYGGGIVNYSSETITVSGKIAGNTASYGGGIMSYGVVIMSGTVSGNTASYGGGILNCGTLTVSGNVTDNKSYNTFYPSGGVYSNGQTITLSGNANITGNTAICGGATVNANLCLSGTATTARVTLDSLTSGAKIGVTTMVSLYNVIGGYQFTVTGSGTANDVQYFTSDNSNYFVKFVTDHLELCDKPVRIGNVGYMTVTEALAAAYDGESETNPTTIKLLADVTENVTIASNRNITLDLNGNILTGNSNSISVITVENGANLTLKDSNSGNKTHNYKVSESGLWTLTTEAKTLDYENLTAIPATNDIIAVKGGAITGGSVTANKCGNIGGGIRVLGKCTMESGNIIGNHSCGNGGGVFVVNNGEFVMTGGKLLGNTSDNSGAAIFLYKPNSGTPKATMKGGVIAYNTTKDGAGVCIYDGQFTLENGTITRNTAYQGGGGVTLFNSSSFIMTGGSIYGNRATGVGTWADANGYGGGLFMGHASTNATITGGTITGNTASNAGCGVYYGSNSTLKLGGTAQITGNFRADGTTADNLYLCMSKKVTIGTKTGTATGNDVAAPASGMNVSVRLATGTGKFTTNGTATDVQYFTSDNADYYPHFNSSNYLELKAHNHAFDYTLSNNDATVTGDYKDDCKYAGADNTLTIFAPSDLTYDGGAKTASLSGTTFCEKTVEASGITYGYKTTESGDYAPVSEIKNAGYYKASFTVGEGTDAKTIYVTYQIAKIANTVSGFSCADVEYGYNPTPAATAIEGAVTYTYSTAKDGNYTVWDSENEAGTYWVKATSAETTNYYSVTTDAISFEYYPPCTYEKAVAIQNGAFHLTFGNTFAGTFTLENVSGNGWTIKNDSGYLAWDGDAVVYSQNPYTWTYKNGRFYFTESHTNYFLKYTVSTARYLGYDGENFFVTDNEAHKEGSENVDVTVSVTVNDHNNHDYAYRDNGDGTHDYYCVKCGHVRNDNEACTYNENGYCEHCGHKHGTKYALDIDVRTSAFHCKTLAEIIRYNNASYRTEIRVSAVGDTGKHNIVKSVQYSLNGKKYTKDAVCYSKNAIDKLYIRVTTTDGCTRTYLYQNGKITFVK